MSNPNSAKQIDQAEELKQLFGEVNQNQSNHLQNNQDLEPKMDILNLPPRKEVHKDSGKGFNLSVSKPSLRFISVVLILIGLIIVLFSVGVFDIFGLLG